MTEIFLDTASMKDIEEISKWGIIKGITTNQKIFLMEKGCNFEKRAKDILSTVYPMPVSLESPNDYQGIIEFAEKVGKWINNGDVRLTNVVVKVPMLGNGDGLRAIKVLNDMNIKSNATACMTLNQTFLAANAGATYVSLFYNRMKDMSVGKYADDTVKDTMNMLSDGGFDTRLIIGSIRYTDDIIDILKGKPHIITIPTPILRQMPFNKKTEETLKDFEQAWKEFKKAEKE